MSPAREYELAKFHAAEAQQRQQLERQQQLEAATAHLSPAERKEAKIVDWIKGGNPWADQGFVPMSETQGSREYASSCHTLLDALPLHSAPCTHGQPCAVRTAGVALLPSGGPSRSDGHLGSDTDESHRRHADEPRRHP